MSELEFDPAGVLGIPTNEWDDLSDLTLSYMKYRRAESDDIFDIMAVAQELKELDIKNPYAFQRAWKDFCDKRNLTAVTAVTHPFEWVRTMARHHALLFELRSSEHEQANVIMLERSKLNYLFRALKSVVLAESSIEMMTHPNSVVRKIAYQAQKIGTEPTAREFNLFAQSIEEFNDHRIKDK